MRSLPLMLITLFITVLSLAGCKKEDGNKARLVQFATEINSKPDQELSNGTLLTGCEYAKGDSVFTYIIKVSDNRYDQLGIDSIKRNFEKTVRSDSMARIVNILDKSGVGLQYKLQLPENEVIVIFPRNEIAGIATANRNRTGNQTPNSNDSGK